MIQRYKNIPGMLVEFKDGGLQLRNNTSDLSTKSMLILGTAKDGPKDPVATDIDTYQLIFGKDVNDNGLPNGATLPKAIEEAHRAGCRDIRVMRVTGDTAKGFVGTASKSVTSQKKLEEVVGYAEGNALTTLTLSKDAIIESSLRVYAKGELLSTSLTLATKALTIPADVTDAGVGLTVQYDYTYTATDSDVTDTLALDAQKKVTLSQTPKGTLAIKNSTGATLSLTTDYTVSGGVVTFVKAGMAQGDLVTITYKADIQSVLHMSESALNGVPFKASTGTQVFTLTETPNAGTTHVYSNTNEVFGAFSVAGKTITINKEKFAKGSVITVTYFANVTDTLVEKIEFESIFAGTVYNEGGLEVVDIKNSADAVIGKKVIITKPSSKTVTNELPLEYSSIDYPTFGQLMNAINTDLRNGVYKCKTDYVNTPTVQLNSAKSFLSGGDDGLNLSKTEIFEKLSGKRDEEGYLLEEGAYQLLEDYNVDYVVLTGVYADDVLAGRYDNFAYELALFCAVISHTNKTTYGYISMSPCIDTTLKGIKDYADKVKTFNANKNLFLMKNNGKVYLDSEGKPVDLGKFIRVVVGAEPMFMSDSLGLHASYPEVAVAAFQTTLLSYSSPMNKKIPNSKGLSFRFSNPQIDAITGANIITFKQKYDGRGNVIEGAYIVDSMTCALPGSDYVRTTTCEVVRDHVDAIREVADIYLGEANTVEQKNSLNSALGKRMGILSTKGYNRGYSLQVISTPMDDVLGKAKIELTIVPPEEFREITTVVGLTPAL